MLRSTACGHHMGKRFVQQKKSKRKSFASQVRNRLSAGMARRNAQNVQLYQKKVQSINWLFADWQSASVCPLAVNPVVWLEWVDLDGVCVTHFSTYQPKNNLSSVWSSWHGSTPILPRSPSLLWLFYHFKFFMPHCRGIVPARAERHVGHTVHSHYSYLDGAPVWLCPGPSVGFCSSISAICAFLRRLWRPRRRQNDWHFSGTTRGTVPRAFSCQWCALTLTKPERVAGGSGGSKQEAWQETAAPTVLQPACSSNTRSTYPCNNRWPIESHMCFILGILSVVWFTSTGCMSYHGQVSKKSMRTTEYEEV